MLKKNPKTLTLQGSSVFHPKFLAMTSKQIPNESLINWVFVDVTCFMKLQVVFSTANFVYKFKKPENFKRRYNANGNANI